MDSLYSLENAKNFNWASISGNLHPERVFCLEKYLVGNKVLDAGCGGGGYVQFLSKNGYDVTGIDKFDEFLQVARREHPQGTYLQGDITELPFEDKSFDCSYCFDVLEHVDDAKAISELARVTRNRLILIVPREEKSLDRFGVTLRHYIDPTHLRYYTKKSLNDLAVGVHPRKVEVFPQAAIDFSGFTRQIANIEIAPTKDELRYVKNLVTLHTFRQMAAQVSRGESIRRSKARKNALRYLKPFLKEGMLSHFSFEKIYTELVAVVDLPPNENGS